MREADLQVASVIGLAYKPGNSPSPPPMPLRSVWPLSLTSSLDINMSASDQLSVNNAAASSPETPTASVPPVPAPFSPDPVPPSALSTLALDIVLTITAFLAYRTASSFDILPSSLPEPWHTLSLLSVLALTWGTVAFTALSLVPSSPTQAFRNKLLVVNAAWLAYAFLCALTLKIKGRVEPDCRPCELPLVRPQSEFNGEVCMAVILALVSFVLLLMSLVGKSADSLLTHAHTEDELHFPRFG